MPRGGGTGRERRRGEEAGVDVISDQSFVATVESTSDVDSRDGERLR